MDLIIENQSGRFIVSEQNATLATQDSGALKVPTHTAVIPITLRWMMPVIPVVNPLAPFSRLTITGASIDLAIINPASPTTPLARNNSAWTIGTNVATGFLDFNTAEMVAFFAGATYKEQKTVDLFCRLTVNGEDTEAFLVNFRIQKSTLVTGTPSPVPGETFYTAAQLNNLFVKWQGNPAGATIDLQSLNNGHHRVIGVNDDGSGMDNYYI